MNTNNVIPLGNVTRLNLPTDRVLEAAKGYCPDGVVIMGFDEGGDLYFASSVADGGTVLWLLEHCKKRLMEDDE
jgi:hypothetical protein